MSTDLPSRATQLTLQDVLAAVAAADLAKAKRQDLASAVRTAARALGHPPEEISAAPLLAKRLAEVAPAALGISPGRWANVRSLVGKVLALTRPMLPGRHREPLSAEWKMLVDKLARGHTTRLSRLLHWLSARGIEPSMVTEKDLLQFSEELRKASLARKPEQTWREVAWVWNKTAREVAGWPTIAITIAARRRTYTLPWSAFPPSLKADVDRYLDRLAGRDLAEDGPRPARPATLELRGRQLRGFASALVHRGRDPSGLTTLADLVTLEAFKTGLLFFYERNGSKTSTAIANLAVFMKSVAKYATNADTEALAKMGAIIRNKLAVPRRGLTPKNRERLRQFDDPANASALLCLPERLMKEARSNKLSARRAALQAQIAVAIEILIMAPMRIENLVNIDLDRHLVRPGRSRDCLHIAFVEDEVKNGTELHFPLPSESVNLIERYLSDYRPLLAEAGNRKLFPGEGMAPKSKGTLRQQISQTIFRHAGLRMHPHLFRHAAAKIYLDCHPGGYEVMRRVLAHKSITTTTEFYTGSETNAAVRHFDEVILNLRRSDSGRRG
jgi:site-specific recombinase XerD